MATFSYTGEGKTEGQVITTANFTAVSGSVIATAAAAVAGTMGYRCQQSGTTSARFESNVFAVASGSASQAARFRWYVKISSYPSADSKIFEVTVSNGVSNANVTITPTGIIKVYNGTGPTLVFTSSFVVPLNTWVRMEMVLSQGGGTTTTGICGFAARADNLAMAATNSTTQAYFYSAATAYGTTGGVGNFKYGKVDTTATWTGNIDWDELAGDNSLNTAKTWTATPSTWIGPSAIPQTLSGVVAMAATAGFTITGAKNDIGGEVLAAAAGMIVLNGIRSQPATLPASAVGSLAVSGATDRVGQLPMTASSALAVAGSQSISFVLAAASVAAMSLGPVRSQFASISMDAGPGAMLLAPVRSQFAVVPMAGSAVFIPIPNPGQSAPVPMGGIASFAVAGSKAVAAGLALGGVGALSVSGSKALSAVLAPRGTPTLTLAGFASRTALWSARATPAFAVSGLGVVLPGMSMAALGRLAIAARIIADIHPYDNVTAVVFPSGMLAVILN